MTSFFITLIFFVLNANLFTPIEIIVSIIFITMFFKGLSHFVLSLIIRYVELRNEEEHLNFKNVTGRIDRLLEQVSSHETQLQSITEEMD